MNINIDYKNKSLMILKRITRLLCNQHLLNRVAEASKFLYLNDVIFFEQIFNNRSRDFFQHFL
jgi:hypothetical protein